MFLCTSYFPFVLVLLTGNVHMWQAIRSASEALCLDDLMLAQAIMEASNISTPSGNLGGYVVAQLVTNIPIPFDVLFTHGFTLLLQLNVYLTV